MSAQGKKAKISGAYMRKAASAALCFLRFHTSSPWRFIRAFACVVGFSVIGLCAAFAIFAFSILQTLPAIERQDFLGLKRAAQAQQKLDLSKQEKMSRWIELGEVSKEYLLCILMAKDSGFLIAETIEPESIWETRLSPITLEVVRNLHLFERLRGFEYWGEVLLGRELEKRFTKQEILEVYLNTVKFAPGVVGVSAAAAKYFQKAPAEIDAAEGAFLASFLLEDTREPASALAEGEHMPRWQHAAMRRILIDLLHDHAITLEQYEAYVNFNPHARPASRFKRGGIKRSAF